MSSQREQDIRERAYAIGEEEGCLDGKEREHWLRAKAEVNSVQERRSDNSTPDRGYFLSAGRQIPLSEPQLATAGRAALSVQLDTCDCSATEGISWLPADFHKHSGEPHPTRIASAIARVSC
jgi:Protein of unknown function (DUF2934)